MGHEVLLVGCGPMATAHATVMLDQGIDPLVIGRGIDSAERFTAATGLSVVTGGVPDALGHIDELPPAAVVAVAVEQLAPTAIALLAAGVRRLLVEKPAGLDALEIGAVRAAADDGGEVFVAYNRRFYASVAAASAAIREDGGVTSYAFTFTERSHIIETLDKPRRVKEAWFLANSTHVVDLAFFLGGEPVEMTSRVTGGLDWHPQASRFAGSGSTASGALFAYHADWDGPGGWGVWLTTKRRRLALRPLESLRVQASGSMSLETVELDDGLDRSFKPGLHRQIEAFLGSGDDLLPLEQHLARVAGPFATIAGGGEWRAPQESSAERR